MDSALSVSSYSLGSGDEASNTLFTDYDTYLFHEGRHSYLYKKFGSHVRRSSKGEVLGVQFAVWAPHASEVTIIGDFNDWSFDHGLVMHAHPGGYWTAFSPESRPGDLYKIALKNRYSDRTLWRSDPFSQYFAMPPNQNAIVWDSTYQWGDTHWLLHRNRKQAFDAPVAIYEMHIGSWRHKQINGVWESLSYKELAELLPNYLRKMNFTHVEFLPVMEHPFYGSWGYQSTGYFAVTHRYGDPDDFKFLVDQLHQAGIGVILDWVPSHFPGDEFGLRMFDGGHLFEYGDPRKGFHPDWKSYIFNFSNPAVCSFLISSALYWLREYHIDGLRVDAVASMLYLDYSRADGQWIPNKFGGHENLDAIDFLRSLNNLVKSEFPEVLMIAEESTAWPGVTRKSDLGGLGFDMKWDMGWMNDTLKYMSHDPIFRKYHHDELTFRSLYAHNENYLLALSHDEVVHEKKSFLEKMPGSLHDKFANLRLLYAYMYALPGKKLLFMGAEIGQRSEWDHDKSLDWHLLSDYFHPQLQSFVKTLNSLYQNYSCLYKSDYENDGFRWIDAHDLSQSVISFLRSDIDADKHMLCAFNFTPVARFHYRIGVPYKGKWQVILNSDFVKFSGGGILVEKQYIASSFAQHGQEWSVSLTLPPLSALYLLWDG